jgi:crotonobetainyl-CoA:carnitine CoA-transferase CaiB-like acyl-CoA transferase
VRKFGGFASAYLSHSQLLDEPQVQALEIVREVPHRDTAARVLDFPVKFSSSKPDVKGEAPRLGEHTHDVMRELGLGEEEAALSRA